MGEHLSDKFVVEGSRVTNSGDAEKIDRLLRTGLSRIATVDGGWRTLYRHEETGILWELSYPQGEMQGGGPRQLIELADTTVENWLRTDTAAP